MEINNKNFEVIIDGINKAIKYHEEKILYNEKMKTTAIHLYGKDYKEKPKYKEFERQIKINEREIERYKEVLKELNGEV